ncbi:unnamed protein product [Ectocarpus sp. CCAP 1310/34]|nr:unnamed protein product [Ectocarpus sp. CCAP 1310/34]
MDSSATGEESDSGSSSSMVVDVVPTSRARGGGTQEVSGDASSPLSRGSSMSPATRSSPRLQRRRGENAPENDPSSPSSGADDHGHGVATHVQRATIFLPYRGIMSLSNPLSHGLLKDLGKLAELKGRGLILERHLETIKTHNGIFDEGEWIAQIDGEIQGITSSTRLSLSSQQDASSARGAAAPSQHPPAAAAGTARRKVDRRKHVRERAAKGMLGGNICNAFSIGSGQPVSERTRGGVQEFVSGISFPPPAPESRRSCPHCPMTFVNEQGLGIHVKTHHSSANMSNGVRLRRMLRKNLEGRVLPWEEAGPGRCGHRKRFLDLDSESDGFMDRETKETCGAPKRRRYDYRVKASAVSQLRILEDNDADLWKEEERTPLQNLADRLKVHYSNIVKWTNDEKAIVAAAADDVKKSLLAKQQPKRWFPEAEKGLCKMFVERRKRKLKVSTLWLTITFRKLVREIYPGDQRAAAFRASFRWARKWAKRHNLYKRRRTNPKNKVPDESDVSAITTVAERESRVPKYGQFQLWERWNVDQVPLAFVNGLLNTWEERGAKRVAISQPFPGLEKRQCTMQVIFGPGEKTLLISVIFRGTGKRISLVQKAAYHKDVDVFFQENAWADQKFLPLAFVNGLLNTWEERGAKRVAISQPFPGLEKRQCTMQVIFGPGEKTLLISVIFRGTGKRISLVQKAAYHKDVDVFFQENAWADQKFCMEWAKRSYREGLMHGRGELSKARSILIMDSLYAQTTDEFKEYLAKECNTLAWYGPSEWTDEVQPVDAGAGRFFKVEAGRQVDMWFEQSDNLERWETAALTASDRRVLITQWIGAAMARLNSQQAFRFRLFEKCGMAMTVDGSGDDRITLEGLDKPYTFANDEDCSEDEEGLENGSDEPEGRGKEGAGRETVVGGADSSDDEDDGGTSQTQTDELALLNVDDSMDPQDPEDETQGMEIPTGFRIQEVKPVALDRLLLRRGVLVRLGMGWFGGLIIQQSQPDTRHRYGYCLQLELDQSTRKMKLPLDKYTRDLDATVGYWVLLESVSRSGRVAAPLGRRIEIIRCDRGGENVANIFTAYCMDSGITIEYAATNTPQQNGVSGRDGQTLTTITRCLMEDGAFPPTLWGELMMTAVDLSNRSPHSVLGGVTPYFKMYGKEADLSRLRVIGARSFVNYERYTKKLSDRTFEGKLCGFSRDSKTYRIYNPATGNVVESRNVTFIETPAYSMPPSVLDDDNFYWRDVLNFTSVLGKVSTKEDEFDGSGTLDTVDMETENQLLRQEIRLMRHNNLIREEIRQQAIDTGHDTPPSPPTSPQQGSLEEERIKIPNSYKETINSPQAPQWKAAIAKEMDSLAEHKGYKSVSITSVPKEEKILGTRFVFKQKADGKFKVSLVVQGQVQESGIDYRRSYAPVCRIGSVRTLLAIACEQGWSESQMDFAVAFLQSAIDKTSGSSPPQDKDTKHPATGDIIVYKLERSLYGISQSPVLWFDTMGDVGDTLVILTLDVDDILISGKDPELVAGLKKELHDRFEMTDMGEVSLILGMQVTCSYEEGTLTVSQNNYIKTILERVGMENPNPVKTPGYGPELSTDQPADKLLGAADTKLYQPITGNLLYLAQCTSISHDGGDG